MTKGAVISSDGLYRYQLWRIWDKTKPLILWIMLNPSVADADIDDKTIIRCIGFTKSLGYGGFYVGNAYAFISTDPSILKETDDPHGPENKLNITEMMGKCSIIVCAWGTKNKYLPQPLTGKDLFCLGVNSDGTPKHPLYLKSDLKLMRYR